MFGINIMVRRGQFFILKGQYNGQKMSDLCLASI